ncbi:MAG: metallophosphoesterase [Pseudomonadota bacterium]
MLILHLSDIHFRLEEIVTPLDPNAHLRNTLVRDAEAMCVKLGKFPQAILISGDIAFAADTKEYEFARAWLELLVERCKCKLEDVFIVPGNHDVVRSKAGEPLVQALHASIKSASAVAIDATLRGFLTNPESSRVLYGPLDSFNLFAGQFFCDVSAPMRTMASRDLVMNDGSILRLIGMNSALVSSQADKPGDLFVDPACFQITKERGVEHLVACHHPYTWLRQGEVLKSHLDDVAKLQLFGHDHTNRVERLHGAVRIAASAAHPDRTEHGWEPGYNLIELQINNVGSERKLNINAHIRVWQPNPGQFRSKMDGEKDVFTHEVRLDSWVPIPTSPFEPSSATPHIAKTKDLTLAAVNKTAPMDSLRSISVRFFKLSLSQKSEIAGKLDLLEDEDVNQPDFERYRSVFMRAQARNLLEQLDNEINAALAAKK